MRRVTACVMLAAGMFLAGLATGMTAGTHHYTPRSCTFDGGGTLVSGDAARTSDGQIRACADGQLYRLPGHFPAGRNITRIRH